MNKNLIATILLVANVVCAVSLLLEVPSILKTKRTYVLTPFMKVVPENTEWTMQELEKMQSQIPAALEARDMAGGYSHLGSTLSIDDVLRGLDSLDKSTTPLTDVQREQIAQEVSLFTSKHKEIRDVQKELLDIEKRMFETVHLLEVSP